MINSFEQENKEQDAVLKEVSVESEFVNEPDTNDDKEEIIDEIKDLIRRDGKLLNKCKRQEMENEYLKKEIKNLKNLNVYQRAADIALPFIMIISFFWLILWFFFSGSSESYIKKEPLKNEIQSLVKNGANLNSIRHYFDQNPYFEWETIQNWSDEKMNFYTNDTLLIDVLADIKNDLYLKGNAVPETINSLDKLINEHKSRNPFDNLEINQKDHFENIRIKLGENYNIISNEVNKISSQLEQQNKLVTQYLSDSKNSYYLSIVSLIFALLTTGYSLFSRGRKSDEDTKSQEKTVNLNDINAES